MENPVVKIEPSPEVNMRRVMMEARKLIDQVFCPVCGETLQQGRCLKDR